MYTLTYNNKKTKWATFMYSGKDGKITKLFRDTQMKMAFRKQNTIQNIEIPFTHT
jgi:hypothetical protein